MRRYVRLTPFEQETPAGRSSERYRRATLSAIADAGAKTCGMGLMFLGVGLTIPYLGQERFGVWVTITSLTAMLALLDFGMGNALINRVANASADPDKTVLVRTASGGLVVLAILGLLVGAALIGLAAVLPWDAIVKLRDVANLAETRQAAIIFAALFGCNIAATAVRSIFIGLQRAYEAHIAMALGYIAAMVAVWLGARAEADVPTLLLLTFGVQLLSAAGLVVLAAHRKLLAWPGARAIRTEASGLVRVGSLFLILQIGTMIGWGGDSLMIAHVLGAGDVTEFNIAQRLFQLVALPLALMSAPLWSAYADAMMRNEHDFLRRTLRASLQMVLVAGSAGVLVIMVIAQPIIAWWTKGAVAVPQGLIVVFAIWTLVQGLGAALGVFLNGTGVIKPQIVAVVSFVMIGLPLKWFFLSENGLFAFVLCSVAAYLVTHLAVYLTVFARYSRSHPDGSATPAGAGQLAWFRHLLTRRLR